jgi:HTH-type transcriptional regulator/antitoxin HigA
MMELRPIRSKREHQAALKEAEALWNAPEGTPEADRLEVLTLLIEAYEREHFPIEDPDPIDFLQHIMEARGLARKDLEPYIGSRARVAEVLNRVRPLTLEMIRNLSDGLELPAEVLIRGYRVKRAA